jgi:hypothetical protein
MKTAALAVASLFAALAPAAHAAYDRYGNYYEPRDYRAYDSRDDYARVIESRPVYADGREECWNNRHRRYEWRPNNRNDYYPDVDFRDCRIVAGRDLQGYDVRYWYNGQEYTTRMSSDPGRRLLVGRDVAADGSPLGTPPEGRTYYPAGGG